MGQNLVRTPFTISKASNGATWLSADLATSTDWKTILSYSVPLGTAIEITPLNYHFGNYYATDTTTKITAGSTKLVKTNATGGETRELWAGANGIFKDIGDEFQKPRLKVSVMLEASQQLLVQVYNMGTTLDSVASDFFVECMQISEQI